MSILVAGLFVGAVAGQSMPGFASLPSQGGESSGMASLGISDTAPVEVSASLVEPAEMITAALSGDDTLIGAATPSERRREIKVRRGDTLMSLMLSAGIDRMDAHEAVTALRSVFDPKNLRAGQEMQVTLSRSDALQEVIFDPSAVRRVAVRRQNDAGFRAFETTKELTREEAYAGGEIRSSLYQAAVREGLPLQVLDRVIHIYSWDVDFQREIQPDDRFEVSYERFVDEDGNFVRHGNVLYAKLVLSGDEKPLYRFEVEPGVVEYFDETGQSAQRALLRTPIDGARLSSRFGKRRHPILGYTRMHRGADFAAPSGTPIYAAGDGVVVRRGRNGGYGNYIQLRHNGRYSTAYAHMKGFARGVTRGGRVRQGQIIGYVGTTGRSTGPHLHYEILLDGTQVNPLSVKMPSGRKLSGEALARFETDRVQIDKLTAGLRKEIRLTRR